MPIMVQCSGCGGKFRASDKAAGKRVKCPTCSAFIDVNGAQTQVPTVPAAAERVPSQQPQDNSFTPGATSEKTELRWARAVWAGGGAIAFILLVACLWFFLLNDSIESFLRKGGKAWSSVAENGKDVGGDDFWIWPVEDHVLTPSSDEQWIKFSVHWQLRPGKTLPANQEVLTCAEMSGAGVMQITFHHLDNGITKGVLECDFDTSKYQGEGIVPFYFSTRFEKSPRPSSNILLLPVRFSR